MKTEVKRCYMCCKPFAQGVKAVPVMGGGCAIGYICPACYTKFLGMPRREDKAKA